MSLLIKSRILNSFLLTIFVMATTTDSRAWKIHFQRLHRKACFHSWKKSYPVEWFGLKQANLWRKSELGTFSISCKSLKMTPEHGGKSTQVDHKHCWCNMKDSRDAAKMAAGECMQTNGSVCPLLRRGAGRSWKTESCEESPMVVWVGVGVGVLRPVWCCLQAWTWAVICLGCILVMVTDATTILLLCLCLNVFVLK